MFPTPYHDINMCVCFGFGLYVGMSLMLAFMVFVINSDRQQFDPAVTGNVDRMSRLLFLGL
jgi:hypothetical protein